jgi:aryl-alcohol dehydrogenase-like predicted oxidoreductase
MTFGGQGKFAYVGTTEVEEARHIVDVAIDGGINFIDTADIYSAGRSEEILGEVLIGRRDEIVLATKARFAMVPDKTTVASHADISSGPVKRVCAV